MAKKFKISFIEIIFLVSFIIIIVGVYYSTIAPFRRVDKFDLNLISQIKTAKENSSTPNEYSFTLITDKISNTYKTVYFKKFKLSKGLIAFVYFWDKNANGKYIKSYLIYYDNQKRDYEWAKSSKYWFNKWYELKHFPTSMYAKDNYLYLKLEGRVYKIILKDDGLDYEIL